MTLGPNYVYQCPNCGNLLRKGCLRSGNTFGAILFSDGKRIAPSLPEFPNLTKCQVCDSIFWLSKLKEIGSFEWGSKTKSEWRNAHEAKFLAIDDYFNAIDNAAAETLLEETIIRQRIWWAYNDRIRESSAELIIRFRQGLAAKRLQLIFNDADDELRWVDNLMKLKQMLDPSDIHQRIMIAEIHRNLGDFANSINIIESIAEDQFSSVKEQLLNACKRKHRWVIELFN